MVLLPQKGINGGQKEVKFEKYTQGLNFRDEFSHDIPDKHILWNTDPKLH